MPLGLAQSNDQLYHRYSALGLRNPPLFHVEHRAGQAGVQAGWLCGRNPDLRSRRDDLVENEPQVRCVQLGSQIIKANDRPHTPMGGEQAPLCYHTSQCCQLGLSTRKMFSNGCCLESQPPIGSMWPRSGMGPSDVHFPLCRQYRTQRPISIPTGEILKLRTTQLGQEAFGRPFQVRLKRLDVNPSLPF